MTGWPTMPDPDVYYGPAGEFVLRTAPHTESDPMALLAQFLVCFGAVVGRTAHYAVEASRHYANEYVVLVGPSSKGRKGSSWDHVERAISHVEPTFIDRCIASGMSSGEGLIAAVADDEQQQQQPEKRRLVLEPEFAQVMKVLAREGNTLSPVVRNAWDGKMLQTMVRNSPLRASNAHIAIVGHITKDELLRHLNATELANGFFNRFMLVAVQRSKKLPFGGTMKDKDLDDVRAQVAAAILHAGRRNQPVAFDHDARETWIAVYDDLSNGHPGMWGAATARAEAHAVRLALMYALLDCSPVIRPQHLNAALAFWTYSSQSARWVFGDSLGDPTADDIWDMAKVNPQGVTRSRSPTCSAATRRRARSTEPSTPSLRLVGCREMSSARAGQGVRPPSGAPSRRSISDRMALQYVAYRRATDYYLLGVKLARAVHSRRRREQW